MKKSAPIVSLSILLGVVLTSLIFAQQIYAQEEQPREVTDDDVNAIAREMYCPVCENIPLDVCPTSACEDWRQDIRDKLIAGWSESQIKGYFVERFGDRVLATPPVRGLNWFVYLIPPIAIVVGAVFLVRNMLKWRNRSSQENPIKTDVDVNDQSTDKVSENIDPYIQELEEEIKGQR